MKYACAEVRPIVKCLANRRTWFGWIGFYKAEVASGHNLGSGVARFDYVLSYTANGVEQGVVGSFLPGSGSTSRDLYFGTCSHGVCTPHWGIEGASLTITTTTNGGATYIKRYRFRSV